MAGTHMSVESEILAGTPEAHRASLGTLLRRLPLTLGDPARRGDAPGPAPGPGRHRGAAT